MSGDGYTPGKLQYTTSDGIAAQGVATEVDIESVKGAIPWLDGLKRYLQERLIPDVGRMTITRDDHTLLFGQLSTSDEVAGKHAAYVTAAIQTYQNIVKSLDAASKATADIVQHYHDVEHNNAVTAQQIEQAFAAPGSTGPGASGTPPTTTTTSTPTTSSGNAQQGAY